MVGQAEEDGHLGWGWGGRRGGEEVGGPPCEERGVESQQGAKGVGGGGGRGAQESGFEGVEEGGLEGYVDKQICAVGVEGLTGERLDGEVN